MNSMKNLGWMSIQFTKISSVVPNNKFTDAEAPDKKRKTGQKRFYKLHLEFLTFASWNGKHVVEGKALVEDSKLPAVDGEDGELQPNDDMKHASRPEAHCINDDDDDTITDNGLGSEQWIIGFLLIL